MNKIIFLLLHFYHTTSSAPQDVVFGDETEVTFGDETIVYFG